MNPQYQGNQGQMPPTGYGQQPMGPGQRPPGPTQNMYNGQSMNQPQFQHGPPGPGSGITNIQILKEKSCS